MESLSKYAACAWVRSPLRTPCRILRTSRSFWLIEIRSVESTAIDMAPPWPGQGGHFYRVMTGHFYCCSTVSGSFFRGGVPAGEQAVDAARGSILNEGC